ncbi:MAG: ABC transporter substrate-binding protein [Acidobacteria bacterium]|nr:MAG: ABC transporter substrate-binding protein [Acidobacteriota bacterium]
MPMKKDIHVAHSPDSDDAFMFYALATRKIDTGDLNYVHVLSDIETLNRKALEGEYEVSAVSFHAYAYMADKYALLSCGASMGRNYGPIVVSGKPIRPDSLASKSVAIPGTLTTAFLTLRLFEPEIQYHVVPFDKILDQVREGKYDAGLLIHEGQLTYRELGLHKVLDLGEWWLGVTGLPLPLGGNVIKRDLGPALMKQVAEDIRRSIQYGLDHREEAMAYAIQFSRGLDLQRADRFVGMYVNDLTLDYGEEGREAVRRLLQEAYKKKIIPQRIALEFV